MADYIRTIQPFSKEWDWCFSSRWADIDNTPTGAALRIEWLLNHGLPKDWRKQMVGEAPLCYYEGGEQ